MLTSTKETLLNVTNGHFRVDFIINTNCFRADHI